MTQADRCVRLNQVVKSGQNFEKLNLSFISYLQSTEDARLAHASMSWQFSETAPENVEMP